MQIVIYEGFGYKIGDSSSKTDKDIEVGGIRGRGIQNIDADLLRMPLTMFIPNLKSLARKLREI